MKKISRYSLKKQGFSLVEIVIAVAVIGIMAAAVVPLIRSTMEKSKKTRADAEAVAIRDAAVSLYSDTQFVPFGVSCLAADAAQTLRDNSAPGDAGTGVAQNRLLLTVGTAVTPTFASGGIVSAAPTAGFTQHANDHFGTGVCQTAADRWYDRAAQDLYWKGPYMTNDRRDPWGVAYVIFAPGTNAALTPRVLSFSDTNPGWVVSAGQEEATIETTFSAAAATATVGAVTTAPTTDVLKKIALR